MTRRDYEIVAEIAAEMFSNHQLDKEVVTYFARALRIRFPNFNQEKFEGHLWDEVKRLSK